MIVIRHISAVLCEIFSITAIMTDGQVEEDLRSTPDLNLLDFYLWGAPKTLVYAAPVEIKETLHHCGCLLDYPQLPPAPLNGCCGP
jgi:hypothetical protein